VTNEIIDRLLKEEANRIPASFIEAQPINNEQTAPKIFSEVENIIKKTISTKASLPELGVYRLRTYNALKGFIRENRVQFSEGFWLTPKLRRSSPPRLQGGRGPKTISRSLLKSGLKWSDEL
jgi:hypothetical protein